MKTIKRFWSEPYQTTLQTTVIDVEQDWLMLAETIVFAFSGGQESDFGSIGGYPIAEARRNKTEISYRLPGHSLRVGDAVEVSIDWDRRYRLMRLHFAAELLLELIGQRYGRPQKIGAHIGADKARVDFSWEGSIAGILPQLEQEMAEWVGRDLPVVSAFSDEATEQRYWEIEGLARVPCGGTHVRRSGEVGDVRLRRNNIGKGKERIEIVLK